MTSEKLRGFVAWHPKHGVRILTNERSEFYSKVAFLRAWDANWHKIISQFAKAEKDGWKIREVELRFVDEEEKK